MGIKDVLQSLKGGEGARPSTEEHPVTDPELRAEAKRLLDEYRQQVKHVSWREEDLSKILAGGKILEADPRLQIAVVLVAAEHANHGEGRFTTLLNGLLARGLPYTTDDLERLLDTAARSDSFTYTWGSGGHLIRHVRRFKDGNGGALTPSMRTALQKIHKGMADDYAPNRKTKSAIEELLGIADAALPDPGAPWTDRALADISAETPEARAAWAALFQHAQSAEGPSKPSAKWLKEAEARIKAVGEPAFVEHVTRWFGLVTLPAHLVGLYEDRWSETTEEANDYYQRRYQGEGNITLLKGLAWMCGTRPEPEVARASGRLAEACFRKVPGIGPWAQRVTSAAIWALGAMPAGGEAVAQLGRLKLRIPHRPTQASIDKTIEGIAARSGMSRDDLEDLSVPTYGFGAPAAARDETFGEYAARAAITATGQVEVSWSGPGGKPLKSVPAEVKKQHADTFKAFKGDVEAAQKTLTAQQQRFETFLLAERAWPLSALRERFFAHPLLGNLARRLIWHFADGADQKAQGIWDAERATFVDVTGSPLDWLADGTEVRLWHPLGFDVEIVRAWRTCLEERGVVQPFKQAHREVYLLTEAELNTATYSNRFAGHLIKQHQMNTLAKLKGWTYRLMGAWDGGADADAVALTLPRWDLKVEFWVEAADVPGQSGISDSGILLYLSTDQVRFYRAATGERLRLTDVPALAFSEVMRDVDLFVGVASVGNDPTWQDRGEAGYRGYWQDYAFGDLSATAQTRRDVLERLLPRLKIRDRCRLDGKFLVVRGDLRTYKIHLGSANILMEPNDQYLCIVQDRKEADTGGDFFLPFEGDQRLALILSKAFLLAEDTKIKDKSITSQIKQR